MLEGMVDKPAANLAVASRIRAAVLATKKPKKEVATLLGVSPQAVTGWEKTGRISKEVLAGLSRLSGVPMEEILGEPQLTGDTSGRYSPDTPESEAQQASHSVRLDPATIAAATRVLQIVFGRRGVTVNLAETEFAELFAVAYEALAEMVDEPNAELLLTAQVIDLIAEREARRGKEGESDGGVDRTPARKKATR